MAIIFFFYQTHSYHAFSCSFSGFHLQKGEYVGSVYRFLKKLLSLQVTKFGISELKVIFLEDLANNFKKSDSN